MSKTKEILVDDIQHQVHHHPILSSVDLDISDGEGQREVVFDLVDTNKYTLRDEFVAEFETSHNGHHFKLVIESFFQGYVSAVFVDTTVFEDTVRAFLQEKSTVSKSLESYNALSLRHVEALEDWGAVGRISTLDPRHIHDAFLEYRPLLREENKLDELLLRS